MKVTGIIRRIDDLGRIVIPKEIRRSLKIREGDPLELFTEGNAIVFKPYITDIYQQMLENIYLILDAPDFRIATLDRYGEKVEGAGDIHIDCENWAEHKDRCFPIYNWEYDREPIGFVWVKGEAPNQDQIKRVKTVIEVFEKLIKEN